MVELVFGWFEFGFNLMIGLVLDLVIITVGMFVLMLLPITMLDTDSRADWLVLGFFAAVSFGLMSYLVWGLEL